MTLAQEITECVQTADEEGLKQLFIRDQREFAATVQRENLVAYARNLKTIDPFWAGMIAQLLNRFVVDVDQFDYGVNELDYRIRQEFPNLLARKKPDGFDGVELRKLFAKYLGNEVN
jgi:hypothetical protein